MEENMYAHQRDQSFLKVPLDDLGLDLLAAALPNNNQSVPNQSVANNYNQPGTLQSNSSL